jgi:hypothetical protein
MYTLSAARHKPTRCAAGPPRDAGKGRGTGVAGLMKAASSSLSVYTGGMHYDESSKRRNLLTGLVFGTLLGAGIALLLAPGDGVAGRARFVARSVRGLGSAGRRTRTYVHALRASIDQAAHEGAPPEHDGDDSFDGDDVDADRPAPVRGMARRRFTL